jgi:hypothetical protein
VLYGGVEFLALGGAYAAFFLLLHELSYAA